MPDSGSAYIGEIAMYGFNFSPIDWLSCNGSLIPIAQNQALFSLLGTTFGGNGRTDFGLPNMNSRSPVGFYRGGSAEGLGQWVWGERAGRQTVALATTNLPAHDHEAVFTPSSGSTTVAEVEVYVSGASVSTPAAGDLIAGSSDFRFRSPGGFGEPAKVPLGGVTATGGGGSGTVQIERSGLGSAFDVQSPVLAVNFSICSEGVYPARE